MLQNINTGNGSDDINFDEKSFLRKARLKSILRIILISLGVAVGVFILAFVAPELILQNQENRINSFYPDLVKFTEPNTYALSGENYSVRLFGRQKEYYLVRLIGNKPYPAGTITVDFDVWGGEQTKGDHSFCILNLDVDKSLNAYSKISTAIPEVTKEYLVPYAVPKLTFYHPAVNYEKFIREFNMLENIPGDYIVEMALSFKKTLTLDEMKTLMPGDLKLMWGAVSVFKDQDYKKSNYLAEKLLGNPYINSIDGEKELINELERLSQIPSYHSDNLKRTVSFLKENGVKYYGVVVVGSPETLKKLSSNPIITGAVLGIVTTPY
ncbi:sigma factor regulator N-terminal domain-containing protein [Caldanaerobius polysaccharolyticus]|uniref:sigma factor regulator N-terminal domain-containing protein n=1 Tax=Caldanaerobius polysaccharolyticus TaxID=44256 RepID=UPI00068BD42D|nr:sigma factor regulator N-terminal domain-containing protein [Caldanaerobius polysaccharolyticus]